MVRSFIACATVALLGLANLASAVLYEDYDLDTDAALSYAAPASVIQASFGTLDETKAVCNSISDCIGVLYREFQILFRIAVCFLLAQSD